MIWTPGQIQRLRDLRAAGDTREEIAAKFGVSAFAIKSKCAALKLNDRAAYTSDAAIIAAIRAGKPNKMIARELSVHNGRVKALRESIGAEAFTPHDTHRFRVKSTPAPKPVTRKKSEVEVPLVALMLAAAQAPAIPAPRPAPVASPVKLVAAPVKPAQTVAEWLAAGGKVKVCPPAMACYTSAVISAEDRAVLVAHQEAMDAARAFRYGRTPGRELRA